MEVLYIDRLFFLNLLADYLLCLSAARISGLRLRRGRYAAAAGLGALYAVAAVLPGFGFLASLPGKLGAGVLMGLIAYGGERRPWRCLAVFFAVSAAFGGALWALSLASGGSGAAPLSLKTLALSFALCYALFRLLFRGKALLAEQKRVEVAVRLGAREARFPALVDTGNQLSDPLTGAAVLVACPHALRPLLGEHTVFFEQLPPVELLELTAEIPALRGRLRLLPYAAVGGEGLLPVLRPDGVWVEGREQKGLLIAVSPQAAGDGFEAIIGSD